MQPLTQAHRVARTGFVYHPDYLEHDMGPGHPESPERLLAITARLRRSGLWERLTHIPPSPAADQWVTQVHDPAYLQRLKDRAPASGRVSRRPWSSLGSPQGRC